MDHLHEIVSSAKNTDFMMFFFSVYDVERSEAIFSFQLKAWFTICCVCWPDLGQKKHMEQENLLHSNNF